MELHFLSSKFFSLCASVAFPVSATTAPLSVRREKRQRVALRGILPALQAENVRDKGAWDIAYGNGYSATRNTVSYRYLPSKKAFAQSKNVSKSNVLFIQQHATPFPIGNYRLKKRFLNLKTFPKVTSCLFSNAQRRFLSVLAVEKKRLPISKTFPKASPLPAP